MPCSVGRGFGAAHHEQPAQQTERVARRGGGKSSSRGELLREVLARDDATPEARKERAAALPVLLSVSIAAGSVAGTMAVATALLRLEEAETSLSPDTEAMLVALEPGLQRLAELYPTEARTLALALALASPMSQTPNPRASWRPKQRSSLHGAGKVRSQRR